LKICLFAGSQAPKYKNIASETYTPKNREKAPKASKVVYEIRVPKEGNQLKRLHPSLRPQAHE